MIMPGPKRSCACATVLFSPGTTNCFSKPKALFSHSIASGASRSGSGEDVGDADLGLVWHGTLHSLDGIRLKS